MIELKEANIEDKADIAGFISRMIGDIKNDEAAIREVEKYYSNNLYRIFLLKDKQGNIGVSVIKNDCFEGSENISEIVFLFISEDRRRQGAGTESIKLIEKDLQQMRIEKVYIKVNVLNIKATVFWLNNGYQFESRLMKLNNNNDYYLLSKVLK